MKTIKLAIFCIILSLSGCAIAPRHNTQHFTCIPTKLFRCEPDQQSCMTIPIIKSLGDVKIAINLADLKVKSYSDMQQLSYSDIDSVQEENGLIYLTGRGHGVDNAYRAWNAVIDPDNGHLYSSSITTGAGHITYGECYEDPKK